MNVIITGTSRGIGRYLAEYYCKKGHHVCGCSRNPSDLDNIWYNHTLVDITNWQDVIEFIQHAQYQFGDSGANVLINNAGVSSMNHTLLTPINTVARLMDTNFLATFMLSKEVARFMPYGGRIINFTSIANPLNLEGEAIYSASKSAVESLTRIMAKELANCRITVNAVGPTPIKTDLIKGVPEHKMNAIIQRQAIKRYGTFEDISNVIDFFIKPESDFITGQVIYLGGVS